MKITGIETFQANHGWRQMSYAKVSTDEGLVGWSEYYEGFGVGGTTEMVAKLAPRIIGRDPREVGPISGMLHAITRLAAGGIYHQAVAAIENALLDIKGKAAGVPVYALFGGPYRTRIPLYWSHCGYFRALRGDEWAKQIGKKPVRSLADIKDLGAEVAASGYKALKTNPIRFDGEKPRGFNPGFQADPTVYARNWDNKLLDCITDQLIAFREGAGPDIGLHLDLNFSLRPEGYLRAVKVMEPFDMVWAEIDLADPKALAMIRRSTTVPIASLESLYGLAAFRPYFEEQAVDVAIIDVIWNGLFESVRIATLADAFEVNVAPHNFYGDLGSTISAHLAAAVPNFRVMEFEADDVPWKHELVTHPLVVENGEVVLSDRPGWGTDVNEEGLRAHPYKPA